MADAGDDLLRSRVPSIFKFRETLTPETDRGCALMGAAYLDSQLEELFRRAWVDHAESLDEMLGQSKPLGTFSARIDMAFLCGFIGARAKKDLHLIRKIRNAFGHDPEPLSFEKEHICNRCRELYHTFRGKEDDPRDLFTSAVLGVLATIHVATHTMKRAEIAKDVEITVERKADHKRNLDALIEKLRAMITNEDKA